MIMRLWGISYSCSRFRSLWWVGFWLGPVVRRLRRFLPRIFCIVSRSWRGSINGLISLLKFVDLMGSVKKVYNKICSTYSSKPKKPGISWFAWPYATANASTTTRQATTYSLLSNVNKYSNYPFVKYTNSYNNS